MPRIFSGLFSKRLTATWLTVLLVGVVSVLFAGIFPFTLYLGGLVSFEGARCFGSFMFYAGLIVCVYVGLSTKFRVDWRLRKQALTFGALLFCVLSVFAMVSAPAVNALTPLPSDRGPNNSSAYKFSVPFTEYKWIVAQFRDGTYYAINGSDWNIMTIVEPWQSVAPWAALASNKTALEQQVLSSTTSGKILLNEVNHNYSLSISANVTVVESLNGLVRCFVNAANTQGSPYTISIDTVQSGYYLVQDGADRFINSWTSTNYETTMQAAIQNGNVSIKINTGDYYQTTSTINVTSNTVIDGTDPSLVRIHSSLTNKPCFNLTGSSSAHVSRITIKGIEFDGTGTGTDTVYQTKAIFGYYADYLTVDNVIAHDFSYTNIGPDHITNAVFSNGVTYNAKGHNGLGIGGLNKNITITNWRSYNNRDSGFYSLSYGGANIQNGVKFTNCYASNNTFGFCTPLSNYVSLTDCTAEYNTFDGFITWDFLGGVTATANSTKYTNCISKFNGQSGLHIGGAVTAYNTEITGCTITDNGVCGVFLRNDTATTITASHILNNPTGILLRSSNYPFITANQILNGNIGVDVEATTTTPYITNNIINTNLAGYIDRATNKVITDNYNHTSTTVLSSNFTMSNLGYSTLGTAASTSISNSVRGYLITPAANGSITDIRFGMDTALTTTNNVYACAAIYAYSSANTPGNLIAQTNQRILVNRTSVYDTPWITFSFSSPVTVTAGTNYFIVVWSNAPLYWKYNEGGSGNFRQTDNTLTYTGTFPSTLSSTLSSTLNVSVYASIVT